MVGFIEKRWLINAVRHHKRKESFFGKTVENTENLCYNVKCIKMDGNRRAGRTAHCLRVGHAIPMP